MGFRTALVDRARTITQEPTGQVIGGTRRFTYVRGEWFRCRLTLPGAPENLEAVTFRRTAVVVPTLLYGMTDEVRDPVHLGLEMRLEVKSDALGDEVWDVVSDPEPLRRKRRVLGWQVTLRRVEDYEFEVA